MNDEEEALIDRVEQTLGSIVVGDRVTYVGENSTLDLSGRTGVVLEEDYPDWARVEFNDGRITALWCLTDNLRRSI